MCGDVLVCDARKAECRETSATLQAFQIPLQIADAGRV
jgi:hypothetical protein